MYRRTGAREGEPARSGSAHRAPSQKPRPCPEPTAGGFGGLARVGMPTLIDFRDELPLPRMGTMS